MNDEISALRRSRPELEAAYQDDIAQNGLLRTLLLAGPYPGIGRSHPDLYKAFAWRNWQLARQSAGWAGVVLPRTALADAGMTAWRLAVLGAGAVDATILLNNSHWVFDDVHAQYQVALLAISRSPRSEGGVRLSGPYRNLSGYTAARRLVPVEIPTEEFMSWSGNAAFPMFPTLDSVGIFRKLRDHPPLRMARGARSDAPVAGVSLPAGTRCADASACASTRQRRQWGYRLVWEFDSGKDKRLFVRDAGALAASADVDVWPVYPGRTFYLWSPDFGECYASAHRDRAVIPVLQAKRPNGHGNQRSAFSGLPGAWIADPTTLPCLHPRIAVRYTTRSTDRRHVDPVSSSRQCVIDRPSAISASSGRSRGTRRVSLGVTVFHDCGLVRPPGRRAPRQCQHLRQLPCSTGRYREQPHRRPGGPR